MVDNDELLLMPCGDKSDNDSEESHESDHESDSGKSLNIIALLCLCNFREPIHNYLGCAAS